jgi:ATP-dependent exoDNAse (exonuclease V), alpha subunit - helicase superfamily I member
MNIFSRYVESDLINESTFTYNSQQKDAIKKSIKNRVLFIWGPPGTGKTTVLGKIISDYVKNDETVLLCSNTNRAVDVSILKALEVSSFEDTPIKEKSLRWGNIYLDHEEDLQYVTLSNHIDRKRKEKEYLIRKEVDLLNEYNKASRLLNEWKAKTKPYDFANKKYQQLLKLNKLNPYQQKELARLKGKLQSLETGIDSVPDKKKELENILNVIEKNIKLTFDSVQALREFVIEKTHVTTEEILLEVKFQSATFAKTVVENKLNEQSFDNILIDEAQYG